MAVAAVFDIATVRALRLVAPTKKSFGRWPLDDDARCAVSSVAVRDAGDE